MADIPSELSTGIVHGRFLFAVIDSDDTSQEPDAVPASGTVKFKASVPYLPVGSTADGPVTVINTVFTGVLDHEGFLCTPYPLSTVPMHRGVRLIATDDPSAAVQDWTWAAEYQFDPVEGAKAGIPSHSFALPSGSAVDLTTLVNVPSSPGYGLPQAEAAVNETIVSASVIGDELHLARRNGETFIAGNVRGDKGDKGDKGDPGDGIPAGGAALQIIRRNAGNTATEWITLDRSHVGLTNVDNTSDADKPVSTAVASALQGKADKVNGFVPLGQIPDAALPSDANISVQINGAQTGAAIDARINTVVTPTVEQIAADYIASQPAVVDAAAAAVDANPKIASIEAKNTEQDGRLGGIESKQATKCVRLEAGAWVWDTTAGTHYVIPDHTGSLIVRATPWPVPNPATPELNW